MNIIEIRALRGPNYYNMNPVIFMKLDIGELEEKPTGLVENFKENIESMIPSLYDHRCSPGRPGGFYERIIRGTWAGHVVEHVALEIQSLAGDEVGFGKTYETDNRGVYNIVYRYIDEATGIRAGEMAVELVEKLFKGKTTDIEALLCELKDIKEWSSLGPSTLSIVNEALSRGIPFIKLNEDSYVQLGQGANQRRIQATMMDNTSALGVEIADDKARTKSILASMGVPVSKGLTVDTVEEALEAAEEIGYPVVMKPLSGNHGRGITVNIMDSVELMLAFKIAGEVCETAIVEKYLSGFDFRILVIDGKFSAATLREPAFVIGNGKDTIKELIGKINEDPNRGFGHEKNMTKIKIDYMTERLLAVQQLSLNSILEDSKKIYIKSTANISAGGIAEDVTDSVHPLNRAMFERISRIIDLNVMGIDIIAKTLKEPLTDDNSGVVEVNAAPGFRMHLNPSKGKARNVAKDIVDMLFPPNLNHSIPIIALTGTNGKTTTARLINHILKLTGNIVGMTSTDGAYIDDIPILKGDYSGPGGASKVIMDSSVDVAVLEVARGGILRRGLGFKECDIGILLNILNISSDHLGEGDINSLEELTRLKSTVIESVKPSGYAVFNADDKRVVSCIANTEGSVVLFSTNPDNKLLEENLKNGNINIILDNNKIILEEANKNSFIANVKDIPITFEGKAIFNIENVLAAVAAALVLNVDKELIKQALESFIPNKDYSSGRMNLIDMGDFKVIIDYGHNTGAVEATGDFIKKLMPGRLIRMASISGNRREEDILKFGLALSKYYDHVIICDPDTRGKKLGETAELTKAGLIQGGFKNDMVDIVIDEKDATKAALNMAEKGDLVVLQVDNIDQVIKDVYSYREKSNNSLVNKDTNLLNN